MHNAQQEVSASNMPAAQPAAQSGAPAARREPRALRDILALDDFEEVARRCIPRPIFGYASGGAETNASLRGNRAAFDDLAFVPKALVELMRRLWKGKLVVKGLLDKDDARIARASGADGIIVSNHGGRQLDGAIAPLRVLPGIVSAAGAADGCPRFFLRLVTSDPRRLRESARS